MSRQALLCLDFINDIVHPEGPLAQSGNGAFAARHGSLAAVAQAQAAARAAAVPVIHVRVAFSPDYREVPTESPVFGAAAGHGVLKDGTWGTEFLAELAPAPGELVITKRRVGAFHGTELDLHLRALGVRSVWVAGVSTTLAVLTTVRDGHDRDYAMTVLGDACVARDETAHQMALDLIGLTARVRTTAEPLF